MTAPLPDDQLRRIRNLLKKPSAPPPAEEPQAPAGEAKGYLGKYKLLERLGRRTWRAVEDKRRTPLALRLLGELPDPDLVHRIGDVLRPLAALTHPIFVPHFKVSHCEGLYFLVRLFVTGRPIDVSGLSPEQGLGAFYQLARATQFLHGRGLVHGGLRPRNIIVDPRGRPFLVDAGIRLVVGMVRGQEELPPGPDSDVADLGTLFLSLLSGLPFSEVSLLDVPPMLRSISAEVDGLVADVAGRILSSSPFVTAEELAEESGRIYQLIPSERLSEARLNPSEPDAG